MAGQRNPLAPCKRSTLERLDSEPPGFNAGQHADHVLATVEVEETPLATVDQPRCKCSFRRTSRHSTLCTLLLELLSRGRCRWCRHSCRGYWNHQLLPALQTPQPPHSAAPPTKRLIHSTYQTPERLSHITNSSRNYVFFGR